MSLGGWRGDTIGWVGGQGLGTQSAGPYMPEPNGLTFRTKGLGFGAVWSRVFEIILTTGHRTAGGRGGGGWGICLNPDFELRR